MDGTTANLIFLAGKNTLATIQEKGLHPDMVRVIAGAAGGSPFPLNLDDLFNVVSAAST